VKKYNANNLLYFDSRMSRELIISADQLEARLARRRMPLKLLYSGRYERLKGSVDAVKVAEICLRRSLDVQMHCYGQGRLKAEMLDLAKHSDGRIVIHDAVPYSELVNIAAGFDVFVCCHIQNDPSCTYLESFGAGLPIVGYANRMWQRLRNESGAGLSSPLGNPEKVADSIQLLIQDRELLGALSRKALSFAKAHCYENEWAKRINALNEAISG
jgi:glycosyltransferase involved in cell wall biosynthesis